MTRSLKREDLDVNSLLRILQTQVVIRYIVSRPQRDCNFQYLYAEVIDLWSNKTNDKFLLHQIAFTREVGLHVKGYETFDVPNVLDYSQIEKQSAEILSRWGDHRFWQWRRAQPFVGLLSVADEVQPMPPTSFLFSFHHGDIEATLSAAVQEGYNRTRREDWSEESRAQYDAIQQLHARFSAFAAQNYIRRVVTALTDGF